MPCHHKSKLESEINQDFDLFFLHEKCEVNEVTQYIFAPEAGTTQNIQFFASSEKLSK